MTPVQTIFEQQKKMNYSEFMTWLISSESELMQSEKDHLSDFYNEGYNDGDRRADYQFNQQYNFYTTKNQ
jgi:hypothetical protein